ncbi:MAG TPA: transglycosylase SLT domain-containing protein [Patescibacteria group bacterium]|nr:transglycosylase SLT domain-containing protein [Patescibacteria group bacterium]
MNDFPGISPQQTSSSLEEARLNALARTKSTDKSKLTDEQKAEHLKAARGFESMFVHMMLKQMRESMLNSSKENGDEEGDMSFGADTLGGFADMQFSDQIAQTGRGMGIADMVYKSLTGEEIPKKIVEITRPIEFLHKAISHGNDKPELVKNTEKIVPTAQFLKPIQDITSVLPMEAPKGNFMNRVQDRIAPFENIIHQASEKFNVPVNLIKAVITAESAGKATAASPVGAKGLMQLMDGTAREMGVQNSLNPVENILGGTKYLRKMMDTFKGNLELALAAYNAGPGNVQKYGGIPPFKETQAYVRRVKGYHETYNADSF